MFPIFGRREDKENKVRAAPRSKSVRAGLWFPVARVRRRLRGAADGRRVGAAAAVYLAAALEYLCAEVLEVAGQLAKDCRRVRIIPRILQLTIRNDEELNRLLSDVIIPCGGVTPRAPPPLVTKRARRGVKRLARPKGKRRPNRHPNRQPNQRPNKPNECEEKLARARRSGVVISDGDARGA